MSGRNRRLTIRFMSIDATEFNGKPNLTVSKPPRIWKVHIFGKRSGVMSNVVVVAVKKLGQGEDC